MGPEAGIPGWGRPATGLCSAPVAFLLLALVVGCAAPAEHPALDQARAAVEQARSAPRVRALAPAELDLAEVALEHASAAARAGAPPDQVKHLAYVASQRAALAEVRAAAQIARSETRLLQRALDQVAFEASLQDRQTRLSSQRQHQAQTPLEEDRPERAALVGDQGPRTVEPDSAVTDAETTPRNITLVLARLPFEETEPTSEALEELAALARRLLREPGRNLLIEADFDLPDPAARTTMERRIDVVRAIFLERGVAPARLLVRAHGNGPQSRELPRRLPNRLSEPN